MVFGLTMDTVKGFLIDVCKDLMNETAFEQFGRIYASICTKFARDYLEEGSGTPPKFLRRFRKRFYRIARLSVIVVDEIDNMLMTKHDDTRVVKFERLFGEDRCSGKDSSAVIEIKSKRRRTPRKDDGDNTEDD